MDIVTSKTIRDTIKFLANEFAMKYTCDHVEVKHLWSTRYRVNLKNERCQIVDSFFVISTKDQIMEVRPPYATTNQE